MHVDMQSPNFTNIQRIPNHRSSNKGVEFFTYCTWGTPSSIWELLRRVQTRIGAPQLKSHLALACDVAREHFNPGSYPRGTRHLMIQELGPESVMYIYIYIYIHI